MAQANRARVHELVERLPESELPAAARLLEALGGGTFAERGLQSEDVAELRAPLASFADEWESPEMDAYDRYDEAYAGL